MTENTKCKTTIFDRAIQGKVLPMGVSESANGVQFSFYGKESSQVRLLFYKKGQEKPEKIVDLDAFRVGNIYSVCFQGMRLTKLKVYEYLYEKDGVKTVDPYAQAVTGREEWGAGAKEKCREIRGAFYCGTFDWGMERRPEIDYADLILYELHVRGYTKHRFSGVKAKGTFAGLMEKIPYLKDLGITAVLLLPCYDFEENVQDEQEETTRKYLAGYKNGVPQMLPETSLGTFAGMLPEEKGTDGGTKEGRLNFWGYTGRAYYFTPKASYAKNSKNAQNEMKSMVRAFHEAGIEVLMDVYFDSSVEKSLMIDCLRHWCLCFHIDGFRINENVVPSLVCAGDPVLSGCKLFTVSWNTEAVYGRHGKPAKRRLGEFNEGFLVDARRLLKSDEGMVGAFTYRFRCNSEVVGIVNYITSVNGFTLMDLVSYDVKHNEANKEDGKDGTDYNYSWNCGAEGATRKKSVGNLRKKQIKNAFMLLLLSQGAPMILAGDEFGNSQDGNNNAYCQDNPVGWVNWGRKKINEEIYVFVKSLIAFRKEHPIFHKKEELKSADYRSTGIPDISFHGTEAWYMDASNYSRVFAVMLNGEYALKNQRETDRVFYLAVNMHWEAHEFDLPKLPKGKRWKVCADTSASESVVCCCGETEDKDALPPGKALETYKVRERSMVLLVGVPSLQKNDKKPSEQI